ncbi:MAG: hypothetical protein WCV81_00545 [Microgenomates group bacterium]|jgi:hypothetical protein
MLDDTTPNTNSNTDIPQEEPVPASEAPQEPPPPAGDGEKAEKYLNQLVDLINQDKLTVTHTDLNKFDITSIEDHYRMDLENYEVEINHSKQPDTGQDFYIMLFNNIKKLENDGQNCVNKVILAYTHLTQPQFENFKEAADAAIERKRKQEEEKRFMSAMSPIDNLLENLSSSATPVDEESADTDSRRPEPMASDEAMPDKEEPEELANTDDESEIDDSPKASDFLSQPPTTY